MISRAQIAAGWLKPAALPARAGPESAAEHRQKLNDMKRALIHEDDESTTSGETSSEINCRADPPRAENAALLQTQNQ